MCWESALILDTHAGEKICVMSRGAIGNLRKKVIDWSVDTGGPCEIMVDERDVAEWISCNVLSALRSTQGESIGLEAALIWGEKCMGMIPYPGYQETPFPTFENAFCERPIRLRFGSWIGFRVAKGLARSSGAY